MARKKKIQKIEEYNGELANYEVLKPVEYTDEEGNPVGNLEVGSIQRGFPVELGKSLVKSGHMKLLEGELIEENKQEKEVEMYNGKKIVSSKEVEINGKKYKEITTEEGSTYTI